MCSLYLLISKIPLKEDYIMVNDNNNNNRMNYNYKNNILNHRAKEINNNIL